MTKELVEVLKTRVEAAGLVYINGWFGPERTLLLTFHVKNGTGMTPGGMMHLHGDLLEISMMLIIRLNVRISDPDFIGKVDRCLLELAGKPPKVTRRRSRRP